MRRALLFCLVALGINSILGQIIIIRELMVVFYGNELSLGIILASWLLWTATGSSLLARASANWGKPYQRLIICQLIAALALPAIIWGIRSTGLLLETTPGEILGLTQILYISLTALAPLGLVLGLIFTLGCTLYVQASGEAAISVGRAYLYEAIGASLGGVLFTYGLVFWATHLQIAIGIAVFNILCGIILLTHLPQSSKGFIISLAGLGLTCLIIIFSGIAARWDNYLRRLSWPGFEMVASKDSIYGNLSLVAENKQYSLFANGLLVFSYPDRFSAEETVHLPLLEHPSPKRVLLISGGVGGVLEEVLKHPTIIRVDYVELDPLTITIGKQMLPIPAWQALTDPRVKIRHIDGRRFVNQTHESYDLILVNLPQPYTAQLNRFYTREFFNAASRILSESGIISLSLTSSENYIGPDLAQFLASIYNTLKQTFPDVAALPGDNNFLLGCKSKGVLTTNSDILVSRLKERRLDTQYVREYYIPNRLSAERVNYLAGVLADNSSARINTDFFPVSYYYDMLLWVINFSPRFRGLFIRLTQLKLLHWLGLMLLLGISFVGPVFFLGRQKLGRRAVLFSVMSTGFAEITFEVVIMLAFQIMFGYMYYKLGIILTGFMIGLVLGSYLSIRWLNYLSQPYRLFIAIQAIVAVYPLILAGIFWSSSLSPLAEQLNPWVEQLFPLLTIIAGTVGGFQFPLANRLYLLRAQDAGQNAGITYAIDLAGSCLGAALTSAILLPILGIFYTCVTVSGLNIIALVLLLLGKV